MDPLYKNILTSIISVLPLGGLFLISVKQILASYNKQQEILQEEFKRLQLNLHTIELKLTEIQSDIKESIKVRDDYKDMERKIWTLESQMKAAWRTIDVGRDT